MGTCPATGILASRHGTLAPTYFTAPEPATVTQQILAFPPPPNLPTALFASSAEQSAWAASPNWLRAWAAAKWPSLGITPCLHPASPR